MAKKYKIVRKYVRKFNINKVKSGTKSGAAGLSLSLKRLKIRGKCKINGGEGGFKTVLQLIDYMMII